MACHSPAFTLGSALLAWLAGFATANQDLGAFPISCFPRKVQALVEQQRMLGPTLVKAEPLWELSGTERCRLAPLPCQMELCRQGLCGRGRRSDIVTPVLGCRDPVAVQLTFPGGPREAARGRGCRLGAARIR